MKINFDKLADRVEAGLKYFKWLYFPIFLLFFLLHKIARILLAISYFGMFEKKRALDIIKYLHV